MLPRLGPPALPALADALRAARGLAVAAPGRVMAALSQSALLEGCADGGSGKGGDGGAVALAQVAPLAAEAAARALQARLPSLEVRH